VLPRTYTVEGASEGGLPTDRTGVMTWDGRVMLTGFKGRLAKLAPGLAGYPVAEIARGSCELATGMSRGSLAGLVSPQLEVMDEGERRPVQRHGPDE
jgi:hypothetical protein